MSVKNKNSEYYLNIMHEVAKKNNGKLLSTEWIGSKKKYRFCFSSGNEFEMKYDTVIRSWPKNESKYLNSNRVKDKKPEDFLNIMKGIAEKNGGKLLSTEWKGTLKKYKFCFANGFEFERVYRNILKKWPNDENVFLKVKRKKITSPQEKLEEIRHFLYAHGHTLISTEWKDRDKPLKVKLSNEEVIFITPRRILQGYFHSRQDNRLVTEPIFKQAFEHLFEASFIKTNKVLIVENNGKKRYLELDGYCSKLKIAFEYQGHPSHWDKEHKRYEFTSQRDILKKKLCSIRNCFNSNTSY